MMGLICIGCAVICAFFAGLTVSSSREIKPKKLFRSKADKQSEEKARILQAEMANFMNYNGDKQTDPKEVVNRGR